MRVHKTIPGALAFCFLLHAQLVTPQAGWTVDSWNIARPVRGFGGNYWLGPAGITGVISAAFSSAGGFIKIKTSVVMIDSSGKVVLRQSAPSGAAIFGFSVQEKAALVYYPATGKVFRYDGTRFTVLDAAVIDGTVLSAAEPYAGHIRWITDRDGTIWVTEIHTSDGAVLSNEPLPGVSAPVLAQPDGSFLFTREGELVARAADSVETVTPAPFTPGSFQTMGNGWIQVNEKNGPRRFAWNPSPKHPQIFQLPGEVR